MACNHRHATRASRHSAGHVGTFLCHNCLRTSRQKWPLRRIRNTGERHQKAPQNKTKQNKPATRFTCNLYRLMPRLRLPLRFTARHNLSFPIRIRLIHVPSTAASISVIQIWSKTQHIRYTWFSSGPQIIIPQLMYINKQRCTNLPPSVSSSVGWF